MRNIRLIALDLDGTILDDSSRLPQRTRNVLKEAADRGIYLVAASGRSFSSLPKEILALPGLVYAITSNGAATYDVASGERSFEFPMEEEKVEKLLELLKEEPGTAVEVFCGGIPHGSVAYLQDPTAFGVPARAVPYIRRTRMPVENMYDFIWENKAHLDSIDLMSDATLRKAEWLDKLRQIGELYLTSSVYYRMEISSKSSGKGAALKKAAELLEVKPEEIIAFGNADNDVDMLKFAGLGVAVANSPDSVKQTADRVCPSNQEEGVAQMLEELLH